MSQRKTKLKVTLSVSGIKELQNKLERYKNLNEYRMKIIAETLAYKGISVAYAEAAGDSHHFDEKVTFSMKWEGKTLYLVGQNSNIGNMHAPWYDKYGNKHMESISPILALEYGTAGYAIKGHNGDASVTGKHTDDIEWYYYSDVDKNGNPIKLKYATAEEAHEPMFKAFEAMKEEVLNTVREVFKNVV